MRKTFLCEKQGNGTTGKISNRKNSEYQKTIGVRHRYLQGKVRRYGFFLILKKQNGAAEMSKIIKYSQYGTEINFKEKNQTQK
jgi:hypothetical protein